MTPHQVTGDRYAPTGEAKEDIKPAGKKPVLTFMGRVSLLSNDREPFQQDGA